jgi:hypothetical protein
MQIAVFVLLAVLLVGFGIGYAVLRAGDGLYRGNGGGARATVGVLLAGCVFLTLRELHAVEHPHGSAENYAGLFDFLLATVTGAAGLGLLIAFLLSFRSPPAIQNSESSTGLDAASSPAAQKQERPRLWR